MFIVDYDAGQGGHDARIVPYGPLQIDPAAKVLHYGEEIFEGLKAYRTADAPPQYTVHGGRSGRPGRRPARS